MLTVAPSILTEKDPNYNERYNLPFDFEPLSDNKLCKHWQDSKDETCWLCRKQFTWKAKVGLGSKKIQCCHCGIAVCERCCSKLPTYDSSKEVVVCNRC